MGDGDRVEGSDSSDRVASPVDSVEAKRMRASVRERLFGGEVDPVKIARYTVLKRIGAGGMGVVYAAYDPELDRQIALKLLRAIRADGSGSGGARARLLREAQAMARLAHPNVIHIYDTGTYEDQVFIAMEYVRGLTLSQWRGSGKRRIGEVLDVFVQAGRGLAAAHAADLVHRDFKPDNVLVGEDGRVRVLDFGLARAAEKEGDQQAPESVELEVPIEHGESLDTPLTRTGAVMGTPAYMAPEQHRGKPTDERSDQFSFCVALWETIHGSRPFDGPDAKSLVEAVLRGVPSEPAKDGPKWLQRILRRGVSLRPADRYPSMDALLAELSRDPGRARRRLIGTAIGGLAVGAGVLGYLGDDRLVCRNTDEKLAGVWDAERRHSVEQAFTATDQPYAEHGWTTVSAKLDDYAGRWARMTTEVCEALQIADAGSEGALLERMACLEWRLHDLRAMTELFAEADVETVRRALEVVSELRAIDSCANADALDKMPALPDDRGLRDEVQALRKRLSDALARQVGGKYEEGVTIVEESVERARSLGYAPVLAEALYRQGEMFRLGGDPKRAEAALFEAIQVAAGSKHDVVATQAWTRLIYVVGHQQGRHDAGRVLVRSAQASLARTGADERQQAMLLNMWGTLEYSRGEYVAAKSKFEQAYEIRRRKLGPTHPQVAATLSNIGVVTKHLGDYDGATAKFREALELREKALGTEHPEIADTLNNLANVLQSAGQLDQARSAHERALALRTKILGPGHPSVALSLSNLGLVDQAEGDNEGALGRFRQALEIWEAALGPDNPELGLALTNMASSELALGRPAEAKEHAERALRVWDDLAPDHPRLAGPLLHLGQANIALDDPNAAVAPLEQALKISEVSAETPSARARVHFALARALMAAGLQPDRALKLAQTAREGYAAAGRSASDDASAIEAWLEQQAQR